MEFSWELAIKAVSAVFAAISLFFTLRNQIRQRRQAIKVDLEILESVQDPALKTLILEDVHSRIRRLYGTPAVSAADKRINNLPMLIFGSVMLVGFAIWTVYLSREGFNWWSLLTGFFALGGFGNIMASLEIPEKKNR